MSWLSAYSGLLVAKEIDRPKTASCRQFIDINSSELLIEIGDQREARWNKFYSEGMVAIYNSNYSLAKQKICHALDQAKGFDERDWRFAETLDELGRINYLLEQYDESEKAQGAAVAELLLTTGPSLKNQTKTRGVSLFISRLALVYQQQGRSELAEKLKQKPYKIFELGYIPLNKQLVKRLGWLVSEYLGAEDSNAANELFELIARIRASEV